MTALVTLSLEERLAQAVQRLMTLNVEGESARLTVPAVYPSGASATVEIAVNGGKCFVSDMGLGHVEAEFHGAERFYAANARNAAERFGVGFDGFSVFAAWSPIDRVEAAISLVANASTQAAAAAVFSAERDKEKRTQEEIYEKIAGIFGPSSVSKSMELEGRTASWNAQNVVVLPNRKFAVFELVLENQNSIASKFLMFSDLSKKKAGYSLNSVVKSIDRIGPKGRVLGDVSHLIEFSAGVDVFRQRARAA